MTQVKTEEDARAIIVQRYGETPKKANLEYFIWLHKTNLEYYTTSGQRNVRLDPKEVSAQITACSLLIEEGNKMLEKLYPIKNQQTK